MLFGLHVDEVFTLPEQVLTWVSFHQLLIQIQFCMFGTFQRRYVYCGYLAAN
jgi:hypothetical protein